MSRPDLDALPALPRDEEGPVFAEPWQAQAFAMTLRLHEQGAFTWPEWTQALSGEIREARAAGEPDLGDTYYEHWLAALEKLAFAKGLVASAEAVRRKEEWRRAYLNTPHGKPIDLAAATKPAS